jgi:sulfoacetaldehyde acetyltransferase
VARQILAQLSDDAGDAGREDRRNLKPSPDQIGLGAGTVLAGSRGRRSRHHLERARARGEARLDEPAHGLARHPVRPAEGGDHLVRHRQQLRHRQRLPDLRKGRKYLAPGLFGPCGYGLPSIVGAKIGCPDVPVVGFAGDGAFGISMNEMTAIGRDDWPPITMVVFRNYQWGAEKRNTTLWYDDNFVGTELTARPTRRSPKACGAEGRDQVSTMDQLTEALEPRPSKAR